MDLVEYDRQSLDASLARLLLGGPQAPATAALLESIVGWQSVDGAAGALVAPVLAVADVPRGSVLAKDRG